MCVISEVQVWERRNNTFVISPGVVRCTVRRLTSELTCAGTQARDPSFARGVTAARDSPAATNSSVTAEHTQVWAQGLCWIWNYIIQLLLYIFCLLLQVNRLSSSSRGWYQTWRHSFVFVFQEKRSLCVKSARNVSCAATIWPNTLKLTRTKKG